MRKSILALARAGLVALMLMTAVLPSGTALAGGKPAAFSTQGSITSIDEGQVKPAGGSGRFVVSARSVGGDLYGPDLVGAYTLNFGTNVPITTQSGQFHGTLSVAGGYEAAVQGSTSLGLTPIGYPGLLIDGTLTFTEGTQGHGQVSGWLIPNIDPNTGHIVGVLAGAVSVNGAWHQ